MGRREKIDGIASELMSLDSVSNVEIIGEENEYTVLVDKADGFTKDELEEGIANSDVGMYNRGWELSTEKTHPPRYRYKGTVYL